MVEANELGKHLRAYANGEQSLGSLEDWIDSNSWDVHQQSDQSLVDAVFEFESLYSAYLDGRMSEADLKRAIEKIADAVRPAPPMFVKVLLANGANSHWIYTAGRAVSRGHTERRNDPGVAASFRPTPTDYLFQRRSELVC